MLRNPSSGLSAAGGAVAVASALFLCIPGRRKRYPWLVVLLMAAATAFTVGSGGSSSYASQVVPLATTLTVSSSASKIASGSAVTFTANLTGTNASAATGSVTFYDGTTAIGQASVSSGTAQLNLSTLAVGGHSISASYAGKSTSLLSASPIQATHGTNLDFSVVITPGASLTGDMTFVTDSDVAALPGSGAPTGYFPVNSGTSSNGVVTGTINSLPGGTYNLYAYCAGDGNYAASKSNPIPVTIGPEKSTTALTVSFYDASTENPFGGKTVPYGSIMFAMATPQGVNGLDGYPTGNVTFSNNGQNEGYPVSLNSAGKASFNNLSQSSLAPGAYQLVGKYSGDKSYNSSVSPAVDFTITPGQVSSELAASSSAMAYSGSVTLTIDLLTDSIGAEPTGTVTFMSGSTILGTATMQYGYNGNDGTDLAIGTATIPGTVFKKNGINSITAVFAGNANYSSSTSNGVAVYVSGVPTPSIGVSGPASLVLPSPGASASVAITVTPFGGFTGAVNLTCSISGPATGAALPVCASASATVIVTAAATATINITSSTTTPSGSYSMTVTGTDAATGKLTSTATIPLTVNASNPAIALAATAVGIYGHAYRRRHALVHRFLKGSNRMVTVADVGVPLFGHKIAWVRTGEIQMLLDGAQAASGRRFPIGRKQHLLRESRWRTVHHDFRRYADFFRLLRSREGRLNVFVGADDGSDKTVAPLGHGFDKLRFSGVVSQDGAKLTDRSVDGVVVAKHISIWPQNSPQLFPSHHGTWPLQECCQQQQCLRWNPQRPIIAEQHATRMVKCKDRKSVLADLHIQK
jgi:hypothetical protein